MSEQRRRFWWWSRTGQGGFTLVDHYDDPLCPHVELQCIDCGWQFIFPDLDRAKKYIAGETEEHVEFCPARQEVAA